MNEDIPNLLVPLPGLRLPASFPWRVCFITAVNEELRRLRIVGYYLPSRFFGYYFRAGRPIGVSGSWTVVLESAPPTDHLLEDVERATQGQYSISSAGGPADDPEFLLLHDRRDGSCCLWSFTSGLRFVEATEAVEIGVAGWDLDNRKLLGP